MSYQEKKTITSIATEALVLTAYLLWALGKNAPADLKGWAVTMLIFIGIGIAAAIVIQIVFHILLSVSMAVKQAACDGKQVEYDGKQVERAIKADMVEDERDKLIDLKSSRVAFAVGGSGFLAGLLALAFGYTPAVMINLLFVVFSAGSIAGEFVKLHYYRKGV